jgi:hypothetical protein
MINYMHEMSIDIVHQIKIIIDQNFQLQSMFQYY